MQESVVLLLRCFGKAKMEFPSMVSLSAVGYGRSRSGGEGGTAVDLRWP
jgi:hypothetical protein